MAKGVVRAGVIITCHRDNSEIAQIEQINPKEYKIYFDWEDIGDHMMARAIEIKDGWGV